MQTMFARQFRDDYGSRIFHAPSATASAEDALAQFTSIRGLMEERSSAAVQDSEMVFVDLSLCAPVPTIFEPSIEHQTAQWVTEYQNPYGDRGSVVHTHVFSIEANLEEAKRIVAPFFLGPIATLIWEYM
jgi:hypothetical protein